METLTEKQPINCDIQRGAPLYFQAIQNEVGWQVDIGSYDKVEVGDTVLAHQKKFIVTSIIESGRKCAGDYTGWEKGAPDFYRLQCDFISEQKEVKS